MFFSNAEMDVITEAIRLSKEHGPTAESECLGPIFNNRELDEILGTLTTQGLDELYLIQKAILWYSLADYGYYSSLGTKHMCFDIMEKLDKTATNDTRRALDAVHPSLTPSTQ